MSVAPLMRHTLGVVSIEAALGRAVFDFLFFWANPLLELFVYSFFFGPLCVVFVRRRANRTIVALQCEHRALLSAGVVGALVIAEARVQNRDVPLSVVRHRCLVDAIFTVWLAHRHDVIFIRFLDFIHASFPLGRFYEVSVDKDEADSQ